MYFQCRRDVMLDSCQLIEYSLKLYIYIYFIMLENKFRSRLALLDQRIKRHIVSYIYANVCK